MNKFVLDKGSREYIVAVVPEYCAGPGWANQVAHVYIESAVTGAIRRVTLQPDEMPNQLLWVFRIGETVCAELIDIARGAFVKVDK